MDCQQGEMANGWGSVSFWPSGRIKAGDWSPAVWRSPDLAESACRLNTDSELPRLDAHFTVRTTMEELYRSCKRATDSELGSFPVLATKSADGQLTVQGKPDQYWIPKNAEDQDRIANNGVHPEAEKILVKAGHLLVTHGQRTNTGRVTAVASEAKYVGTGWMPVLQASELEAKALAVFFNSTAGRMQLLRTPGTTLGFPLYNPADIGIVRIPDPQDERAIDILADCWERTKDMVVPQFRDGECEVRRMWDEAVCEAMGWDVGAMGRLRGLLHREPHVSGRGYGEYGDEEEG